MQCAKEIVQSPEFLSGRSLFRPHGHPDWSWPTSAPPLGCSLCIPGPWARPRAMVRGLARCGLVLCRQVQGLGGPPAAGEYVSPLIEGHMEDPLSAAESVLGSGHSAVNKTGKGTNHLVICLLKNPRSRQNGHLPTPILWMRKLSFRENSPGTSTWTSRAHTHFALL